MKEPQEQVKQNNVQHQLPQFINKRRRRYLLFGVGAILLVLILLVIVALILALTIFKPKDPKTQLLSVTVDGFAPRVSLPIPDIQLNVSLNLEIMVQNRNHASFKHGPGKATLFYKEKQVGDADIYPGLIPAKGSATLPCRLTLDVDELASNLTSLITDVINGQVTVETSTRIPGKISFLGIFRKHAVAISKCQFTIAFPDIDIQKQDCSHKTKF